MPNDTPEQPNDLASLRQRSQVDIDAADEQAALERIRLSAGLGESANAEILDHFGKVVQQEAAQYGESETAKRWENRTANPEGWKEVERSLAQDMRQKAKRFTSQEPAVKCQQIPDSILKGRQHWQLSDSEMDEAKKIMQRENDQKASRAWRRERGMEE